MPFCTNCGSGLDDNELFCSQCGNRREKDVRSSERSKVVNKSGSLFKPRNAIIVILGIVLVIVVMQVNSKPGKTGLPKEINNIIFEESEFSAPITLKLPCEDHPENIERLKNNIERYQSSTFALLPTYFGPAMRIEQQILDFFINKGFANIEEIRVKYPGGMYERSYKILTYNNKISPFIYKGDYQDYRSQDFEIRLASRQLKSIDYVNEYEDPLRPGEIFAVTFSYSIKKDFPYLEELIEAASGPRTGLSSGYLEQRLERLSTDKIYKGEAEAYLSPSDGQWKLVHIILEDR